MSPMDHAVDPLKACEREQLHLSNAIQPHGVLLHVGTDGAITHASANVSQLIGAAAETLLERGVDAVLPGVASALGGEQAPGARAYFYTETVGANLCDLAAAKTEAGWLIEVFRAAESGAARQRMQAPPQFFKLRKQGLTALSEEAVRAVQQATGFDKVMAYRFRNDWTGEVIAEASVNRALDDYLGQRFPASDIPKIARDLYLRNPFRSIPDVAAVPVPIVGIGALDLTFSELRSVSPVHLQYLRNMAVGASCSFAVAVRGQLWGLIACHHAAPREIPLWARTRSAEAVKDFAFAIATLETDQRMRFIDRIDATIERIVDDLDESIDVALEGRADEVLDLVGATGAALVLPDRCVRLGRTPTENEIRNIVEMNAANGLFQTEHLAGVFPAYDGLAHVASGALVVHAGGPAGASFAWFRPEERRTIVWAGNPHKLETGPTPDTISPRVSFARWTESMEGRSRPWMPQDLIAAQKFRTSILRWVIRIR